jgi:ArsR family transcriptional regulator, arsenate/arsenite/antimonite-responsive transcriptional repressor
MGASKTDHYSHRQNHLALLAKAIGHPARIAIIDYLVKTNKCICDDIVNVLPLAQATVSQHLKELKNAGLIKGNIDGNAICYCVDEKNLNILKEYLTSISKKLEVKNTCC